MNSLTLVCVVQSSLDDQLRAESDQPVKLLEIIIGYARRKANRETQSHDMPANGLMKKNHGAEPTIVLAFSPSERD